MKNIRLRISSAGLSCILFAACVSAAPVRAVLNKVSMRTQAPRFRLSNASGRMEQLTSYRGKVVVLNFWATDCGGCRMELPWLIDIAQEFQKRNVAVIGISMDISYEDLKDASEAWGKVTPFVASHQITYPILMAEKDGVKGYDTSALPVTYLIDTHGRIAARYAGLIDEHDIEANIHRLLNDAAVTNKKSN